MRMNSHLREHQPWRSRANYSSQAWFAARPTELNQLQTETELGMNSQAYRASSKPVSSSTETRARRYSFNKPGTSAESRKACPYPHDLTLHPIPEQSHKHMLRRKKGLRLLTDLDNYGGFGSPASSSSHSRSATFSRRTALQEYSNVIGVNQGEGENILVEGGSQYGGNIDPDGDERMLPGGWDTSTSWGLSASLPISLPTSNLRTSTSTLDGALGKYPYAWSNQRTHARPSNSDVIPFPESGPSQIQDNSIPSNNIAIPTQRYQYPDSAYTPHDSDSFSHSDYNNSIPINIPAGPSDGAASLPSNSYFSPPSPSASFVRSKSLPPNSAELIIHQPQPIRPLPTIVSVLSAACDDLPPHEEEREASFHFNVSAEESAYQSDNSSANDEHEDEEFDTEVTHAYEEPGLSPSSLLYQPVADAVRFYSRSPSPSSSLGSELPDPKNGTGMGTGEGCFDFPDVTAVTGYYQPHHHHQDSASQFRVAPVDENMNVNMKLWCNCGCMGAKHALQNWGTVLLS